MNYLGIFIGGGLGSLFRFLTIIFFKKYSFFTIPLGTLVSNVIASLLLGFFVGYFLSKNIESSSLRNFIVIGFCGGFSTFSSFAFENHAYLQQNQIGLMFTYITISIGLSVLAIFIGMKLFGIINA